LKEGDGTPKDEKINLLHEQMGDHQREEGRVLSTFTGSSLKIAIHETMGDSDISESDLENDMGKVRSSQSFYQIA
jgi:hypothetical protein